MNESDRLEDWFKDAKTVLTPEQAKWAYRLARAKGLAVVADRNLRALESIQHSVDYALITHTHDAQRQLIREIAPHVEQFAKAKEDLAQATALTTAAETILGLLPTEGLKVPRFK